MVGVVDSKHKVPDAGCPIRSPTGIAYLQKSGHGRRSATDLKTPAHALFSSKVSKRTSASGTLSSSLNLGPS